MTRVAVPRVTGDAGRVERVLVVDDDPTVAEVVTGYLQRAGYAVEVVGDGAAALDLALRWRPHVVVLDLLLPGVDGLEVCRRLKQAGLVQVVMLTALGEEDDRVLGLETGADDYVSKPFSPRELVLRVRSVLRRTASGDDAAAAGAARSGEVLTAGNLELDVTSGVLRRRGQIVALRGRELDLLAHLLRNPDRTFSRLELLETVWGWSVGDQSTVTVHVHRIREKIEDDPSTPRLLVTVWGSGYRFDLPAGTNLPSHRGPESSG